MEVLSALVGALILGGIGFAIGWAGRSPERSSWDLLIWLYAVVGGNIGLLIGGVVGALLARRRRSKF